MTLLDRLRPYLGRLLGTAVGAVATWLLVKYGVVVDKGTQQQVVDAGVIIIIAIFSVVREITHKAVNKNINPGDTASAHLAADSKTDAAASKTREHEAHP